jgi:hypothetical protein
MVIELSGEPCERLAQAAFSRMGVCMQAYGHRAVLGTSLAVFSVVFVASRLWLIEGDLAPFEMTNFQKIDAFYYAALAFEWFDGNFDPQALRDRAVSSLPNGIFYNVLVYLNLLLFGDTYFGFRLNVVVVGLVVSLIFSYVMYLRFSYSGLFLSCAIYLITFPWFMASLDVEPTIYRLLHLSAVLLVVVLHDWSATPQSRSYYFWLSVVAYFGPFFVYPTNVFVIPVLIAFFLLRSIAGNDYRSFANFIAMNFLALLLVAAAWLLSTVLIFGGVDPVVQFFGPLIGARVAIGSEMGFLEQILFNFRKIDGFFLFRQLPGTYYIYIVGLLLATVRLGEAVLRSFLGTDAKRDWSRNDAIDYFLSFAALAFFCQTLFINDYPLKKLLFLTPFLIYFILVLFELVPSLLHRRTLLVAAALYICVPNLLLVRQHLFLGYTERFKSAMIDLRSIGDARVGGGVSHAFRLYNDYRPFLNYYIFQHVLHDRAGYYAVLRGEVPGVDAPEYTIMSQVNDKRISQWRKLGFVLERIIIDAPEKAVGKVGLFKRVE